MKLKSYFSGTVEAALALARKELGEETLLVNARPATPETRSLGAFEVVFGVPDRTIASESNSNAETTSTEVSQLRRDLNLLRDELNRALSSKSGASNERAPMPLSSNRNAQSLLDSGLSLELIERVAGGTPLQDQFRCDSSLGKAGASRAVIAFVGPPGAGKTTSLGKLAARYGLASRKTPLIISCDVNRISAVTQLQTLASILGIRFEVAETAAALQQLLEEHASKGMIFIDTPGIGPRELDEMADLALCLSESEDVESHLVIPANLDSADMLQTTERFRMFRPSKLLFTHLDETERYGALVSESVRGNLPISFLSNGQRIPEDIEPASAQLLAGLVMSRSSLSFVGEEEPKRIGAAA